MRPKTYTVTSVRLPLHLRTFVQERAREMGITESETIRRIVAAARADTANTERLSAFEKRLNARLNEQMEATRNEIAAYCQIAEENAGKRQDEIYKWVCDIGNFLVKLRPTQPSRTGQTASTH